MVVLVVAVVVDVVVELTQLSQSTGQSVRVATPNSECLHCEALMDPQKAGSADPLHESVVVVVVVAVAVVKIVGPTPVNSPLFATNIDV